MASCFSFHQELQAAEHICFSIRNCPPGEVVFLSEQLVNSIRGDQPRRLFTEPRFQQVIQMVRDLVLNGESTSGTDLHPDVLKALRDLQTYSIPLSEDQVVSCHRPNIQEPLHCNYHTSP